MERLEPGLLEILAHKPERIIGFDDAETHGEPRAPADPPPRACVLEVAGRDSIAAGILAADSGRFDYIIPTVVYTGTEYGDFSTVLSNVEYLAERLRGSGVQIAPVPVVLGSTRWWHSAAGRYAEVLQKRYGFCPTCVACHMYLHAARVPYALLSRAPVIVAGERTRHDRRLKLNQLEGPLEAYRKVLGQAGVELILPLRDIEKGEEVQGIVGDWDESDRQLRCVLESNYRNPAGGVDARPQALEAYLEEFLEPFFNRVLGRFAEGDREPDYDAMAHETITGRGRE